MRLWSVLATYVALVKSLHFSEHQWRPSTEDEIKQYNELKERKIQRIIILGTQLKQCRDGCDNIKCTHLKRGKVASL